MKFMKNSATFAIAAMAIGGVTGTVGELNVANASSQSTSTMTVKQGVRLNVRSGAGTNYRIMGKLTGGSKVTGSSKGNGWFKISGGSYNNDYVSMAYLNGAPATGTAPSTPSTPKKPSTNNGDDGVSFSGVTVREQVSLRAHSAPSTSSSVTRYIAPNSHIDGTIVGDWIKTTSGDYLSRGVVTDSSLSNGNIPSSRLCSLPTEWNTPTNVDPDYTSKTPRLLDCYAAKNLTNLENAYKAQFGHYAAIDLGYRSLSEQNYWYNLFGYPRAAIPGTSNHGLGLAVDFRETDRAGEEFGWGGYGFNWLQKYGPSYGFTNTFPYGTDGESYHHDFQG